MYKVKCFIAVWSKCKLMYEWKLLTSLFNWFCLDYSLKKLWKHAHYRWCLSVHFIKGNSPNKSILLIPGQLYINELSLFDLLHERKDRDTGITSIEFIKLFIVVIKLICSWMCWLFSRVLQIGAFCTKN